MANLKLSELAEMATPLDLNDEMYVNDGGTSKRVRGETLRNQFARVVTAVFGDGMAAASREAGQVCYVRVPYAGTITEWNIVANDTTTCVVDVWKAAGSKPTNANSITAAAKPALTAATVGGSTTLTGWTTTVAAGDVIAFELESVSGVGTQITLTLKVI